MLTSSLENFLKISSPFQNFLRTWFAALCCDTDTVLWLVSVCHMDHSFVPMCTKINMSNVLLSIVVLHWGRWAYWFTEKISTCRPCFTLLYEIILHINNDRSQQINYVTRKLYRYINFCSQSKNAVINWFLIKRLLSVV